jgi:hypothetical protein
MRAWLDSIYLTTNELWLGYKMAETNRFAIRPKDQLGREVAVMAISALATVGLRALGRG